MDLKFLVLDKKFLVLDKTFLVLDLNFLVLDLEILVLNLELVDEVHKLNKEDDNCHKGCNRAGHIHHHSSHSSYSHKLEENNPVEGMSAVLHLKR